MGTENGDDGDDGGIFFVLNSVVLFCLLFLVVLMI